MSIFLLLLRQQYLKKCNELYNIRSEMDAQNVSFLIVIMLAHLGKKDVLQLRHVMTSKYVDIRPFRMLFSSFFFITLHDIIIMVVFAVVVVVVPG